MDEPGWRGRRRAVPGVTSLGSQDLKVAARGRPSCRPQMEKPPWLEKSTLASASPWISRSAPVGPGPGGAAASSQHPLDNNKWPLKSLQYSVLSHFSRPGGPGGGPSPFLYLSAYFKTPSPPSACSEAQSADPLNSAPNFFFSVLSLRPSNAGCLEKHCPGLAQVRVRSSCRGVPGGW